MNPIFKDIVLLIVSFLPLMGAWAESIVDGSWRDFGVENQDTVIVLNCNELVNNANTPLFYADFRDWFTVEADFKLNTRVTEQAFICKEGRNGDMAGDLTIGFDPEEERIFAEIKDEDGNLHRIKAGDKVDMGKWYSVNIDARKDANGNKSNMKLSVKPEGGLSSSETMSYKGNALPYHVGRWVVGRGYPGGFPNSLQVRGGEIKNLRISGEGLDRVPGQNPIFTDRFTADPACTVVGDRLYAYVGEDMAGPGGWFSMPHWVAYSTSDMKTWECHGPVLAAKDFPYANPYGAWAAQVVEKDGKFYFYVTLDDIRNGKHMIDVAVGDTPLGPFLPAHKDGTPLITDDMTTDSHRQNADIDPTVLIDDDGTAWIAWGNGDCYVSRLKSNMIELEGDIRHIGLRNYSEGPWLFKHNGIYYNVYAADAPGVQPEQIAYSTAKSIEGPWTYGGLLTGPARHGFTIHPSVNEFKGKWYFFYHDGSYMIDGQPGGDCRRRVCVEEMKFNPDGSIVPINLTEEGISKIQ
ncbi:MAG: family 43 glycosylhydrolase [Muribaculaceae bacterium]|nr:family 43 glycosylhydrolase [Muribaculaceae bacterium]